MIPKDFDWVCYLEINEDLRAAGLTTKADAINHYINHGMSEDRCYKKIELPQNFDWRIYLLLNLDLLTYDLYQQKSVINHYLSIGHKEKKSYIKGEDCKVDEVVIKTPIYLFYHIWAKNDWYDIFQDQIYQIKTSGLWDNLQKVFINISGLEEDKIKVLNSLDSEKVFVQLVENNFEYPTIELIHGISQVQKFKGIYIHAKSTSYSIDHHQKWIYQFWRKLLDYQLLSNWKSCYFNILSYDLVGSLFRNGITEIDDYWINWSDVDDGKFRFTDHFSGNFWWFDSDYFSKLPKLTTGQKENRFNAEWYTFQNHPTYFNIFNDSDLWIEKLENKINKKTSSSDEV